MSTPNRRTRRLALLAGGAALAALGAALPLAAADAESGKNVSCTADIGYSTNAGLISSYAQTFTVSATTPYSEDRSTRTRFEFFDANLNAAGNAVEIAYFKDVSVFDSIDLRTTVPLGGTSSASNNFFNSAGQHLTGYTITCK